MANQIDKKSEIAQAPVWPTRRHNPRERKVLSTSMEYIPTSVGDWPGSVPPASIDEALDTLAQQVASPLVVDTILVEWNMSVHGGAVGLHSLSTSLPAGAILQHFTVAVPVALVSPTSAGTITLDGLSDIPLTSPASSTTFSLMPAHPQTLSSQLTLQARIAGEPLTAGVVRWYLTILKAPL